MILKQLTMVLTLSVLMTACGGDDNKKSNNSSSSKATSVSSKASSVAVSSSSVAVSSSSAAMSSVVSSSSSVAVSSSSSSQVVVIPSSSSSSSSSVASSSSSSVASSEASSSSSSSAGGNAANCEPNPDSVINTCDTAKWVVDGGNGGTFVFGELGPIFTNGAPTGTESYNVPGMFYVLEDPVANATVVGKTLSLVLLADQALKDTGANIQLVIQENGGSYGGDYSCWFNNSDILVGQEFTVACTHASGAPKNGIASLRLGFQLKDAKNYLGTLEIIDATWK